MLKAIELARVATARKKIDVCTLDGVLFFLYRLELVNYSS